MRVSIRRCGETVHVPRPREWQFVRGHPSAPSSVQDRIRDRPEAVAAAGALDAAVAVAVDGSERLRQPDLAAFGAAADERWDHRRRLT